MSAETPPDNEKIPPIDNTEETETTILKWDGNKWNTFRKASNMIMEFVYEDTDITLEKELPKSSLELNSGVLYLLLNENDKEIVKKIVIDKQRRSITIVSSHIFKGSIKQVTKFRNVDDDTTEEKVATKNLYSKLVSYKLNINMENEAPQELSEPTSRKRHKSKTDSTPKRARISEKSVSQLNKEHLINLTNRISQEMPSESENRYILLDLLKHDFTIRKPSDENVQTFLHQIKNGKWNADNPLFVNKLKVSDSFQVFNGNARLAAIIKFNEETADKQLHILSANCKIFDELNLDQKLIVSTRHQKIESTEFKSTILEETKIVQNLVEFHKIEKPSTKDTNEFVSFLNALNPKGYSPICIDMIQLPEEVLNEIYSIKVNDIPIEHLKLSIRFWNAFIKAEKNNSAEALLMLLQLENKSPGEVEKLLKNIKPSLLEFLKKRGPHDFETDEKAIEDLTGGLKISKEELMNALRSVKWLQNKERDGANWDVVKTKLKNHFRSTLVYKDAHYVEKIDEALLSIQNFIVAQNQTVELKNLCKKYEKNFVFLLIGNLGEAPLNLPDVEPTAVFDVVFEQPIKIDKVIDYLPETSTKAYLYLPNAPVTGKITFLSELAMEKGCPLATTWILQTFHHIAKLAKNYDNILFLNTSTEITNHFLNELTDYQHIYVYGNENIKKLVDSCNFNTPEKVDDTPASEEFVK